MIFRNMVFLFYPFSMKDYRINIIADLPYDWGLLIATLDGIILVIWIVYLELKHKISDFI